MSSAVLTLNAGSSSLKFALYQAEGEDLALRGKGLIEGIPTAPHLIARGPAGQLVEERHWESGRHWRHEEFLDGLLEWVEAHIGNNELVAAGHRVVHGGTDFAAPVRVDDDVLAKLDALCPLAPLHQPHNLAVIRAIRAIRPNLPQIACFDTAFHHSQPDVATRLALPRELRDQGLRRYGFHGLSYEFIARQLRRLRPALARKKIVVAHLGNGASLCALDDGKSIDTTMGFTALDGLVMGTRCGSIDPGVLLHLLQRGGMTVGQLEDLLYHRSGLFGLSGESCDMRALQASASEAAAEAIDSFVYRIGREMGAMVASLGGLDGVVFTGGIGENAPKIRSRVAERLAWLGAKLDEPRNQDGLGRVSSDDSAVEIWVIPTDEETMIAKHSASFVNL